MSEDCILASHGARMPDLVVGKDVFAVFVCFIRMSAPDTASACERDPVCSKDQLRHTMIRAAVLSAVMIYRACYRGCGALPIVAVSHIAPCATCEEKTNVSLPIAESVSNSSFPSKVSRFPGR